MDQDKLIGRNLARLRGDLSQQELASRMRELGFKWSQSTVWSLEKGERPLRLAEASSLNRILGLGTSSRLLWREAMLDTQELMARASEARSVALQALGVWEQAQLDLAIQADDAGPEALGGLYPMVEGQLSEGLDGLKRDYLTEAMALDAAEKVRSGPPRDDQVLSGPMVQRWNATWRTSGEHQEAT